MTPKEKAEEIVGKYISFAKGKILFQLTMESAKQCALIAVDEMLYYFSKETFMMAYPEIAINEVNYWQDVKKEIEAL